MHPGWNDEALPNAPGGWSRSSIMRLCFVVFRILWRGKNRGVRPRGRTFRIDGSFDPQLEKTKPFTSSPVINVIDSAWFRLPRRVRPGLWRRLGPICLPESWVWRSGLVVAGGRGGGETQAGSAAQVMKRIAAGLSLVIFTASAQSPAEHPHFEASTVQRSAPATNPETVTSGGLPRGERYQLSRATMLDFDSNRLRCRSENRGT